MRRIRGEGTLHTHATRFDRGRPGQACALPRRDRPVRRRLQTDTGWIAAVQNDEPDNDAVVHRAMEEGRLRRAPVLLIDMRVDSWIRRYPDVHVQTVAARRGGTRRIENRSDSIQLAVVGSADAEHVARLVWPDYHPVLGDANHSLLLIRD